MARNIMVSPAALRSTTPTQALQNSLVIPAGQRQSPGIVPPALRDTFEAAPSGSFRKAAASSTGSAEVTGSASPDAAFQAGGSATSQIQMGQGGAIQNATLTLGLTHTDKNGISVYLTGPDGQQVKVPVKTDHDMSGTVDLSSLLKGKSTAGTWTLTVKDSMHRDAGTLKSWSLDFNKGAAPTPTPTPTPTPAPGPTPTPTPAPNPPAPFPNPDPSNTPKMQYFGGGVLDHAKVTNMYIGDYFGAGQGAADRAKNDAFMSDLVQNKNMTGIWNQYGVGAGETGASVQLGGTYKSGQKITQAQIEKMLQGAVASGKVTPGAQSLYNFVLPPGAVLVTSDGTSSTQGLGGFHGSIHTPDGKEVYYSANAFSHGSNGIDFTGKGDGIDNVTITESHEVSEAVTDPNVQDAVDSNNYGKLGWMDVTTNSGEIGDVEVNDAAPGTALDTMYGNMDGYYVQKIWSQKDGQDETAPVKQGGLQPLPRPAPTPKVSASAHMDDDGFVVPSQNGRTTGWNNS